MGRASYLRDTNYALHLRQQRHVHRERQLFSKGRHIGDTIRSITPAVRRGVLLSLGLTDLEAAPQMNPHVTPTNPSLEEDPPDAARDDALGGHRTVQNDVWRSRIG
jgi:hypothetical protein